MTDLTQITCPPGLLDDETFEALREWEHGLEWWNGTTWVEIAPNPIDRDSCCVYRARPAPVWKEASGVFQTGLTMRPVRMTISHTGNRLPAGRYTGPDGATITVEGEL